MSRPNRGSLFVINVPTTPVVLVGANPQRVALSIGWNNQGAVITISDSPDVTFGEGFNINPNQLPFVLTVHNCGDWLQKQLYAVTNNDLADCAVLEVICPCQEPPLPI